MDRSAPFAADFWQRRIEISGYLDFAFQHPKANGAEIGAEFGQPRNRLPTSRDHNILTGGCLIDELGKVCFCFVKINGGHVRSRVVTARPSLVISLNGIKGERRFFVGQKKRSISTSTSAATSRRSESFFFPSEGWRVRPASQASESGFFSG